MFKISKTIHNFPSTKTQEERKEDLKNLLEDEYGDDDDQNIIKTRKRPQPGCNKQPNESRDGDHPGSSSVPSSKKKAPKFKIKREKVSSNYIEYKLLKSANDVIKGENANEDSAHACFDINDEDDLFVLVLPKESKRLIPSPSRVSFYTNTAIKTECNIAFTSYKL